MNPVETFEEFLKETAPRVRAGLLATLPFDRAVEATAEANAYAWEEWDHVSSLEHPVPYLVRVGRSRTRPRMLRHLVAQPPPDPMPDVEPALGEALGGLSSRQRAVVTLVHGYGWTLAEASELLGIHKSSVQRHLERGMARLRNELGVGRDERT